MTGSFSYTTIKNPSPTVAEIDRWTSPAQMDTTPTSKDNGRRTRSGRSISGGGKRKRSEEHPTTSAKKPAMSSPNKKNKAASEADGNAPATLNQIRALLNTEIDQKFRDNRRGIAEDNQKKLGPAFYKDRPNAR